MRLILCFLILIQFPVFAQEELDPRREFVEIYEETLKFQETNDKVGLRLYFLVKLSKEHKMKTLIGKSGLNFLYASFLKDIGEFDSSVVYFNRVEYYASLSDPERRDQMLSKAYLQKSFIYFDTQKWDSARVYLNKTKSIENLKLSINELAFLNNIEGYFAYIDGDYKKAERIYDENIEIHKMRHPCELPLTFVKKIELYDKLNNLDKMNESFHKALYYVDSCGNGQNEVYLRSTISSIYERRGDFKRAFENYKIARIVDDSLKESKKLQEMAELDKTFRSALKDTLIKSQRIENDLIRDISLAEKKKGQLYFFGLIALSLCVLGIILILQKIIRQKKELKQNKLLLEQSLGDKKVLLKEIHHRVKNNFQIVSSILDLQTKGIEDPKAIELANEGKNRVKSMALIHQNLYQNDDLKVKLGDYTKSLLTELNTLFSTRVVDIELDINHDVVIDIDLAIPLGLILNELTTNSFKYGFPKDSDGKLNVSLINLENENCLMYKDNGPGLDEGIQLNRINSVGLRLVKRLSKQIGGRVEYSYNHGAEFKVYFRKN